MLGTTDHAADQPVVAELPHPLLRATHWLMAHWRPDLGWFVLALCMLLASLPSLALGENRVAELQRIQASIDLVGPSAVLATWLILGWRRPRRFTRWRVLHLTIVWLLLLLAGIVILSQTLIRWIPGLGELWSTLLTGSWPTLGMQLINDWLQLGTRFGLWWQGVRVGGAAQDNLIFAALAGLLFWLLGVVTAWLVRRRQPGLVAAVPLLWLLGTILLYSGENRSLMVGGIMLALALHLLLDQQRLIARWQRLHLDYSADLPWDRLMTVLIVAAGVFLAAGLMPNLYSKSLVTRYYQWIAPVNAQLEAVQGRLFPELTGVSYLRGRGSGTGLPNAFLLGEGSTLGQNVVMHVRTDDTSGYEGYPFEMAPPPGHYMRGSTLATYDGHGWSNANATLARQSQNANTSWTTAPTLGRKSLVQSVTLFVAASILYAAPEPMEPGVDYQAEVRADGDLMAIWQRARNYTVVSAIPAVSEAMLAAAPGWDAEHPLPPAYAIHLELPDTVTERTRQLAAELVADQPTPFAKARAIELFLRQYTYDLAVPAPPTDVVDIVDYFLFDLQRGYCDYYATAFIVLARLAGLPARFATGYAPGYWDAIGQLWVVTEEQAHSWPEVYFPDYGWIPFEPTAGRSELARIGVASVPSTLPQATQGLPAASATPTTEFAWNWQMLFWLLPLLGLGWLGRLAWQQWRQRYEDPWLALLQWGRRVGRPLAAGETVLEYGDALAAHVIAQQAHVPDAGRVAAREILALCQQVNALRYAPALMRTGATAQISDHWARLRAYLPQLQTRRNR